MGRLCVNLIMFSMQVDLPPSVCFSTLTLHLPSVLCLNSCIIHNLLLGRAVLCWKVESKLNKLKNSCKRTQ